MASFDIFLSGFCDTLYFLLETILEFDLMEKRGLFYGNQKRISV